MEDTEAGMIDLSASAPARGEKAVVASRGAEGGTAPWMEDTEAGMVDRPSSWCWWGVDLGLGDTWR